MTAPLTTDAVSPADPAGETALFVYAVLRADSSVSVAGLDGSPVELVTADGLAAATTPIAPDRRLARRADLLSYGEVVDTLARSGPVAPLRYGTVLPDRAAVVEEVLEPEHARLAALLDRLDGTQQYTLRAAYDEDVVLAELVTTDPEIRRLNELTRGLPPDAGHRERMQLGELVARALQVRSEIDADQLLEVPLRHCVSHVVRNPPTPKQVLDAALLVDVDHADDLLVDLEELAAAVHPRVHLSLVGPTAPYDFVSGVAWD